MRNDQEKLERPEFGDNEDTAEEVDEIEGESNFPEVTKAVTANTVDVRIGLITYWSGETCRCSNGCGDDKGPWVDSEGCA